jgi:hypothetical protein
MSEPTGPPEFPTPATIGGPPSADELYEWLMADALVLRDTLARIRNRWLFVRSLGEEYVGPPWVMFNLMSTIAEVYYGTGTQPQPYNFDEKLAEARRGQ